MYNKTEELKNTVKPWIKTLHDQVFGTTSPVWRLEFSLYSLAKAKLVDTMEKAIEYNSLDVLKPMQLYGIFQGLFMKKFQFRTCGTAKRIARMKPLHLWHFDIPVIRFGICSGNVC